MRHDSTRGPAKRSVTDPAKRRRLADLRSELHELPTSEEIVADLKEKGGVRGEWYSGTSCYPVNSGCPFVN